MGARSVRSRRGHGLVSGESQVLSLGLEVAYPIVDGMRYNRGVFWPRRKEGM